MKTKPHPGKKHSLGRTSIASLVGLLGCLVATPMRGQAVGDQSANLNDTSFLHINEPKFNQPIPLGPVKIRITLTRDAEADTMAVYLNGTDILQYFSVERGCGIGTYCVRVAEIPQELVARGVNVLTAEVAGPKQSAVSVRSQFEYADDSDSLTTPVQHLVPGVAVRSNYISSNADPSNYRNFSILVGPGPDFPQRSYSAADLNCPAGINSVQALVLDPATLDPDSTIESGTNHVGRRCFGDAGTLQTFLKGLPKGRLVIANSFYGQMPNLNTTAIGGTDYTQSGSRGSRDYSIVGIANSPVGSAYESYQPFHQAIAYIPSLDGSLMLDNLQNYVYVPRIDRQMEVLPNNVAAGNRTSTVVYAGEAFSQTLPGGAEGGFYLFGIDRQKGYVQYFGTYSTNQSSLSASQGEMDRLANDLAGASPDILFALTTIGRPFSSGASVKNSLFEQIQRLGGTGYVLPVLAQNQANGQPNTYTLISGNEAGLNAVGGLAIEQSSYFTSQQQSGAVQVLLVRDRANRFTPDSYTPEFVTSSGLKRIAQYDWQAVGTQTPQDWPTWSAGQRAAYNDLTSGRYPSVGLDLGCNPGSCPPIRTYYSGIVGGGSSAALNIHYATLAYVPNGAYSASDFESVVLQLRTEQGYLNNVQAVYRQFAVVTGDTRDSLQHQLTLAARTIEDPIRRSNANAAITAQNLKIAATASSILSGIPYVGAAASAVGGLLNTVSTVYASPQSVPQNYQIVLQQLVDGNATLGLSMATGNNVFFTGIATDWGKLQVVGGGYGAQATPWYMCTTCVNANIPSSAIPAVAAGAKAGYFVKLIPNLYKLDYYTAKSSDQPSKLGYKIVYSRNMLTYCSKPYGNAPADRYLAFANPAQPTTYDLYFFVKNDYELILTPVGHDRAVFAEESVFEALFSPPLLNFDGTLGGGAGLIFQRFAGGSGRPLAFRTGIAGGTPCS